MSGKKNFLPEKNKLFKGKLYNEGCQRYGSLR